MTAENTVAHRDAVKAQIADVRRRIDIAESRSVDPEVMAAGIEQARRDLDALTSPALEDLRETAEELSDDIEHTWMGLCNLTLLAESVADKAPAVPVPPRLIEAIRSAITARAQLIEQLHTADIDTVDLPVLPPYRHVNAEAADVAR